MGPAGPPITVIIDTANELAKVRVSLRTVHEKNHIKFLFTRFEAIQSEPITKPIFSLNRPFTIYWINGKSVVLEMLEDGVEDIAVMLP